MTFQKISFKTKIWLNKQGNEKTRFKLSKASGEKKETLVFCIKQTFSTTHTKLA